MRYGWGNLFADVFGFLFLPFGIFLLIYRHIQEMRGLPPKPHSAKRPKISKRAASQDDLPWNQQPEKMPWDR